MTNGASNRVQQVFSPGEQVLTKTGKRFEIEEIGAERIRFRLLASGRRMSLKQSRLARVIENFKEIRNSDNLERASAGFLVADRTANLWLRVLHKTLPPVGYFNHEIELLMKTHPRPTLPVQLSNDTRPSRID